MFRCGRLVFRGGKAIIRGGKVTFSPGSSLQIREERSLVAVRGDFLLRYVIGKAAISPTRDSSDVPLGAIALRGSRRE